MKHEHKFGLDETIYNNGLRMTVKSYCACGAIQREIHAGSRYGTRKTVLVTENNGQIWESHQHRHEKTPA